MRFGRISHTAQGPRFMHCSMAIYNLNSSLVSITTTYTCMLPVNGQNGKLYYPSIFVNNLNMIMTRYSWGIIQRKKYIMVNGPCSVFWVCKFVKFVYFQNPTTKSGLVEYHKPKIITNANMMHEIKIIIHINGQKNWTLVDFSRTSVSKMRCNGLGSQFRGRSAQQT